MKHFQNRFLAVLAALVVATTLLWPTSWVSAQTFFDQNTYGATSGGSGNAYTLNIASYGRYIAGVPLRFLPNADNTGAATLNVNGLGAKNILEPTGAGLASLGAGRFKNAQPVEVLYDGTEFVLMSSPNDLVSRVPPQGYLTPCQVSAGSPVTGCLPGFIMPNADVTAATVLYYEPNGGDKIPIWNGFNWVIYTFTEAQLTLTLNSTNNLANTLYDACVAIVAGVPTIMTGPAWTNSGAGTGARGSTTGTASITQQNGVWVNTFAISGHNGVSTYSIPAAQCTAVATVLMGGTNGQVASFTRTYGQSRVWPVSNFYTTLPIILQAGDPTTTPWVYNTQSYRLANANAANSLTILQGLPQDLPELTIVGFLSGGQNGSGTNSQANVGISLNGNLTPVGITGGVTFAGVSGGGFNYVGHTTTGYYTSPPFIGINVFSFLESGANLGSTTSFNGGPTNMLLKARFNG